MGRSFSLSESDAAGLARHRTVSAGLVIPSRGLRVPWGVEQDLPGRLRPLGDLIPGSAFSYSTAARLWTIPLPSWLQNELTIHVSCPRHATPPRRTGVTGHRVVLMPGEITDLEGLSVTTPARTWLDLARLLDEDSLVAAGDAIVNAHKRSFMPEWKALTTIAELRGTVQRHPKMRGIRNARTALELVRVGADSAPETFLRLRLIHAGLPEPELGYVIVDSAGREIAWPDLAFPEYRVALQYDGGHHFEREQAERDIVRNEKTAGAGWIQITVTARTLDALRQDSVEARVARALQTRGWVRSPRTLSA